MENIILNMYIVVYTYVHMDINTCVQFLLQLFKSINCNLNLQILFYFISLRILFDFCLNGVSLLMSMKIFIYTIIDWFHVIALRQRYTYRS